MGITAKELAERLGISTAAVSMALNDKPGVSAETKKRVRIEAERLGYDFSRIKRKDTAGSSILFVVYKKSGAVVADTPFFSNVTEGIRKACNTAGFRLSIQYLYEADMSSRTLDDIRYSDHAGLIILGTEMLSDDLSMFLDLSIPVVILDSYFENFTCDTVLINNSQGSYQATRHLIRQCKSQPGYLRSSYRINNFNEREEGFRKAVRSHGMSISQSIVHDLTPSLSGSYSDMKGIIASGEPLARCYFADNDLIAIGAMRAIKEAGLRIPEDIAIVGFDNLPMSQMVDPMLTTIHVPQEYMGEAAVRRLSERLEHPDVPTVKTEVGTLLIDRYSC